MHSKVGQLTLLVLLCFGVACTKPMVHGTTSSMTPYEETFAEGPNAVYYAIRYAMAETGYPVGNEDLAGGLITTSWVPIKSDSHYIQPLRRKDYGVVNAYHYLDIRVMPTGGGTKVSVTSQVKSVVYGLKSSGREEKKLLAQVANYLRSGAIDVTNLGVTP